MPPLETTPSYNALSTHQVPIAHEHRYVHIERAFRLWIGKHVVDRFERRQDRIGRRPCVFEQIQAHFAGLSSHISIAKTKIGGVQFRTIEYGW